MDQDAKQQIIDRLTQANNVLVTVSANPSVDQLAACIGLTLLLNKLGKHGTAVFSGKIPSTLEFLKPEDTIETNTDSLRDFIISLDKAKADKLRYKVEDTVVKIFITPYRTSLSQKDLDFSQGDFNVDVVIGLGVHERTDLDKAIMAHGRILHDATVISVNNRDQGTVGAINWVDLNASSLSEMLVSLSKNLTTEPLDAQMATAFMTGIVAETARFSNSKTSPSTMTLASELMSAGANQQLIASKLENTSSTPAKTTAKATPHDQTEPDATVDDDGALRITHNESDDGTAPPATLPPVVDEDEDSQEPSTPAAPQISKLHDDESPLPPEAPAAPASPPPADKNSRMALQPPTMGGKLTANSEPEHLQLDPSTDPLSAAPASQILNRSPLAGDAVSAASTSPAAGEGDEPPTLASLEASVNSPHVKGRDADSTTSETATTSPAEESVEEARDAVNDAINAADSSEQPLEPIQALGAQPVNLDLHDNQPAVAASEPAPDLPASSDNALTPALDPPLPYFPPPQAPVDSSVAPPASQPLPGIPSTAAPGLASPAPFSPPPNGGIDPNIPPQLMPTSPVIDTTAAPLASPAPPPPVPPPMMPPAA